MNCFTSLGSVLFTFHVQGCSALVVVAVAVVVVVAIVAVVLASFQCHNTSTSPKTSQATESPSQPARPVQRSCLRVQFYLVFGQLSLLFCS